MNKDETMPLYDYICADCGPFKETAPISQYDAPCACPTCGTLSERNLLCTPQVSAVSSLARKAHAVNERSADSPRRAKANGLKPSGPRIKSKAITHASGSKSLAGNRPWMLSH